MKAFRPEPWAAVAALLIAVALPALFMKMRTENAPSYQSVELYSHESEETLAISLEEYVARMLAKYSDLGLSDETLKCLACALRTSALLSSPAVCGHAYCDDPEHSTPLPETYGEREAEAVRETAGMVVVRKGALVPAAVHVSSYLVTQSAFNISGIDLPCLVSVSSPEIVTPEVITIDDEKMKMTVEVNFGIPFDPQNDGITVVRDNTGRAAGAEIAGYTANGREFARALGLASDCFTVERSGEQFTLTVYGEGDGLGLSVMGAEALSANGYGYGEILAHYYTGAELVRISELQLYNAR